MRFRNINIFLFLFLFYPGETYQLDDYSNSPPVLYLDQNWNVYDDERNDTVVARVQAHDNEQDILTFGLTKDELLPNRFDNLPFYIDPNTGIVRLNDSLIGHAGERFFIYVTVKDDHVTTKSQVMVHIKSRTDKTLNNRTPLFSPPNTSGILPPFHLLPGVPPRPPTNFNLPTIHIPPSQPSSSTHTRHQTKTYPEPDDEDDNEMNKENDKIDTGTTKTNEMPFNTNDTNKNGVIERNNTIKANVGGDTIFDTQLKTILPIAIIGCGIMIAAALVIASFLFRKRLCAIGKSLKKKSKEEMAKKSMQSNNGVWMSSLSGDSRGSTVIQHWNGPTAFGNRYVPWEREGTHSQVCAFCIRKKIKVKLSVPLIS